MLSAIRRDVDGVLMDGTFKQDTIANDVRGMCGAIAWYLRGSCRGNTGVFTYLARYVRVFYKRPIYICPGNVPLCVSTSSAR